MSKKAPLLAKLKTSPHIVNTGMAASWPSGTCGDNERAVSWQTADVVAAGTTDVLAADTTDIVSADTADF